MTPTQQLTHDLAWFTRWQHESDTNGGNTMYSEYYERHLDNNGYAKPKAYTVAELVATVKAHATKHYNEKGWDYIVETQTDEEIAELIAGASTPTQAIKRALRYCSVLDERRRDVQGEVF